MNPVKDFQDSLTHNSNNNPQGIDQQVWVTRWADFSSKYGLGYGLSDGTYGVSFNDQTKIVQTPHNVLKATFRYYERRLSRDSQAKCTTFSTNSYPSSLHKKVILLGHFKDFLKKYKPGTDSSKDEGTNQPQMGYSPHFSATGAKNAPITPSRDTVMVKKWVKTSNAMIFRLSNKAVQVVFNDKTEVILSSAHKAVWYSDKKRQRRFYRIQTDQPFIPELEKRMKYCREVLSHLLASGPNKQQTK